MGRIDLSGMVFGRLTALAHVGKSFWECECSCGRSKKVYAGNLRSGHTKSCGCLLAASVRKTHRMSKTVLYSRWRDILNRCYRNATQAYKHYGGRGITVCDEWRTRFEPFRDWALANGYTDALEIDRIDVNGNYEPSNCRFVTHLENARNTRTNVLITHGGDTKTMSAWAVELKIPYKLLQQRITRDKLSFAEAITKPIRRWPKQPVSDKYTPDPNLNRRLYAKRNSRTAPI